MKTHAKIVPVVAESQQDHFVFHPICDCDPSAEVVKSTMDMMRTGRPQCGSCGYEMKIAGQTAK